MSDQLSSTYAHSASLCGWLGRVISDHWLKCFSPDCLEDKGQLCQEPWQTRHITKFEMEGKAIFFFKRGEENI